MNLSLGDVKMMSDGFTWGRKGQGNLVQAHEAAQFCIHRRHTRLYLQAAIAQLLFRKSLCVIFIELTSKVKTKGPCTQVNQSMWSVLRHTCTVLDKLLGQLDLQ